MLSFLFCFRICIKSHSYSIFIFVKLVIQQPNSLVTGKLDEFVINPGLKSFKVIFVYLLRDHTEDQLEAVMSISILVHRKALSTFLHHRGIRTSSRNIVTRTCDYHISIIIVNANKAELLLKLRTLIRSLGLADVLTHRLAGIPRK